MIDPKFMIPAMLGMVPTADSSPPAWSYRGWLLWYVQGHHGVGACNDRWGYLAECFEAGQPVGPIPKIAFRRDGVAYKSWVSVIEHLANRLGWWDGFIGLLDFLVFSLGMSSDPGRLPDPFKEHVYRKLDLGPALQHPYDYLGQVLAEVKAQGWNPHAFYPTPHEVCEAMASMTFSDGCDPMVSVNDPCAGTGRTLLHASNYSLNLYAQDIDPTVLKILKINGAMYAPWLVCRPPFLRDHNEAVPTADQ